jgi:hypothetical protein
MQFRVKEEDVAMFHTKPTAAYTLSAIIAVLTMVAAVGGLFIEDLYRDNAFARSAWRGTDLVTLAVAVPLLIIALILALRGSFRAQLVWLGMLDYTLYNYAYYLFGTAFNRFFLIYVALFTLSMLALIFALVNVEVKEIRQRFRDRTPVKWIGGYMLFVAAGIGGLWIAQSLSFVVTGQVPEFINKVAHPTSVVFALDLSLVVPFLILGAIWLCKRQPWGYVLAAILCVKGTAYMLALVALSTAAMTADFPSVSAELPLWSLLSLGFLAASLFLVGNVKSVQAKEPLLAREKMSGA